VLLIVVLSLTISGCAVAPTESPANVPPADERGVDEVPIGQHFVPFDSDFVEQYGDMDTLCDEVPFDPLYVDQQPANLDTSYDDAPIGQHFVPFDPDYVEQYGDMDINYDEVPFDPLYVEELSK
jgi:hypothetical protein